jgi:hypothetical protein
MEEIMRPLGVTQQEAIETWLTTLKNRFRPHYTLENISGGHDEPHVGRMETLYDEINPLLGNVVDRSEFVAAGWLHNVDRSRSLHEEVEKVGLEQYCRGILKTSPFSSESQNRIAVAVREHINKPAAASDGPLTLALKTADAIDRFNAVGVLSIAAHRGSKLPIYDLEKPFGFTGVEEQDLKTLYHDFMRVTSWYSHLFSDEARELANKYGFRTFIGFIRWLATDIARFTNQPNTVEQDLAVALGPYYSSF